MPKLVVASLTVLLLLQTVSYPANVDSMLLRSVVLFLRRITVLFWLNLEPLQHQRPDPAADPFTLDVSIVDASKAPIGGTESTADAPKGEEVVITTKLADGFKVTAGDLDDAPLVFTVGGATFDSNSAQCSVGSYDNGKRDMDCGFPC